MAGPRLAPVHRYSFKATCLLTADMMQHMNMSDLDELQLCSAISDEDFKRCLETYKKSQWSQSMPKVARHMHEKGFIGPKELERFNSLQSKCNEFVRSLIEFVSKKSGEVRLGFIDGLTTALKNPTMRDKLMEAFRDAIRASRPCRVELVTTDAKQLGPDLHKRMTDQEKDLLLCPVCCKIMEVPVLLKCLHSCCRSCIESPDTSSGAGPSNPSTFADGTECRSLVDGTDCRSLVDDTNETMPSKLFEVRLSCPLCTEEHRGVLQENRHILLRIALLAERLKASSCRNNCDIPSGNTDREIFHCDTCGYVCSSCVRDCSANAHSWLDQESFRMNVILTCREHDLPLEYFCRDCNAWRCKNYLVRTCIDHAFEPFFGSSSRERAQIEQMHDEIRMRIDCVERLAKLMKHAHLYGTSLLDSRGGCIFGQENQLMTQFQSLLCLTASMSTPDNATREQGVQCDFTSDCLEMGVTYRAAVGELVPSQCTLPVQTEDPQEHQVSLNREHADTSEQLQTNRAEVGLLQTGSAEKFNGEKAFELTLAMHPEDVGDQQGFLNTSADVPELSRASDLCGNSCQACTKYQCKLGEQAFKKMADDLVIRLTVHSTTAIASQLRCSEKLLSGEQESIMNAGTPSAMAYSLVDTVRTKGIPWISEFYRIWKSADRTMGEVIAELYRDLERCSDHTHFP